MRAAAAIAEPSTDAEPQTTFRDLALGDAVLKALADVGYESPSPIQAATIPPLLAGKDVVGQAQTGTGKTAAFALPILSKLNLSQREPQALVLAPTRELAIQVAEAFQKYAAHLPGFHVLPIYGGQSYTPQLQSLKRGAHVVVGTPGRVMDHIKKGTLDLSKLAHLVLDEGDEMLRMGFIDDVEWILEKTPKGRQVALFSATMPPPIRRIAQRHLNSPVEITIRSKTTTATNIRQRYWMVSGMHKLDALTRVLEAETFDAMLVFTRTKQSTTELAERLGARGFAVEALNGDIQQAHRERTIARLKSGQIDIVVATDVAARGLDVDRISHVVNFDVPHDSESYIHRIGRTGRAGRSGEAIIFIAPRERNMLHVIERATRQPIEHMQMPTMEAVNQQRIVKFKERIAKAVADGEAQRFRFLVEQFEQESGVPALDIAAALVSMAQGRSQLLLDTGRSGKESGDKSWTLAAKHEAKPVKFESRFERTPREERVHKPKPRREETAAHFDSDNDSDRASDKSPSLLNDEPAVPKVASRLRRDHREADVRRDQGSMDQHRSEKFDAPRVANSVDDIKRETFRIEVGHAHGVKPGNIVGAIANEAGLEGKLIGRVDIRDDHSFVDLPEGMPKQIFRDLQKTRVGGQELRISRADAPRPKHAHHLSSKADRPPRSDRPRSFDKPHRSHKPHGAHKGPRPSRSR